MSERCPRCRGSLTRGRLRDVSCLACGHVVEHGDPIGRVLVEESKPVRDREAAPRAGRRWTQEERTFVFEHLHLLSHEDIGKAIDRTAHAVEQMTSKAKVSKPRIDSVTQVEEVLKSPSRVWTEAQLCELEVTAVRGNLKDAAKRLGRSYWSIRNEVSRRGLAWGAADDALTIAEVSRKYRCSVERVKRLIATEVLPARKVGRYWRIRESDALKARRALRATSKHTPRRWRQ